MSAEPLGPVRERSLAPDLARGWMLLLIAVANVPLFAYGVATDPTTWDRADRVVVLVRTCAVDGRAYPLFALLFGYGLAAVGRRAVASGGADAAARVLRRRSAWLAAIGVVHGVLLFSGDVASAYGVCGVVLAAAVARSSRRAVVATTAVGTLLLVAAAGARFVDALTAAEPVTGPWSALVERALLMAASVALQWLFVIGPVAAGVLIGWRAPALDSIRRRTLALVAVAGGVVAVLGGLGGAEVAAGMAFPSRPVQILLGVLWGATGLAGAAAWLAGAVLVAQVLERRGGPGPVARVIAACGARSLTCYLAQSVAWVALLAPWTLDLGGRLHPAGLTALAAGVWAATVLLAAVADRLGYRGPFEVLLRRLTYGRAG